MQGGKHVFCVCALHADRLTKKLHLFSQGVVNGFCCTVALDPLSKRVTSYLAVGPGAKGSFAQRRQRNKSQAERDVCVVPFAISRHDAERTKSGGLV